jgi:hypothetical protein
MFAYAVSNAGSRVVSGRRPAPARRIRLAARTDKLVTVSFPQRVRQPRPRQLIQTAGARVQPPGSVR